MGCLCYSFSIAAGTSPPSCGFDAQYLVGFPSAGVYAFTVQVTDSEGRTATAEYTLVVEAPALSITSSSSLPDVQAGSAFNWSFAATGGAGGYIWSAPNGLSAELTLSSAGQLTGTVSSPTNVSFVIRVTDSNGSFVDQSATLLVTAIPPPPALVITSAATLSDVLEGSSYSWGFSATGGDGIYTWSLPNNGQPAGLSLSADGQLSGTLTATSNTYYFTVQVTDGNGSIANQSVSMNVSLPPPPQMVLSGQETLEASIWSPFAQSFAASGSQAACAWSLSGAIPDGVSISSEGLVSGMLDGTLTTYSFVVSVTDGFTSASQPVTLNACDRDADGDGLAASLEHEIALESGYALHDGSTNSNGYVGNDSLIYYYCRLYATDHLNDVDGDGLGPILEARYGTDPTKAETGEGWPDWRYAYQDWGQFFDTVDADGDGLHANLEALIGTSDDPANGQDSDGDGLSDAWEWSYNFYSSPVDDDSDNDGLKDGEELNAQTQARDEDTDDDHLTDREEVMRVFDANLYLNPLNPDTDADGVPDFAEVILTDTDGGGIPDRLEDFWGLDKNNPVDESWDVDSDEVSNVEAYEAGWDIFANWQPQFDGDGDGMDDIYELARPSYLNAWDRRDGADDPDADFLTNAEEYRERINPRLYLTPVRPSKRRTVMAPEGPRSAANDYEQAYGKVLNTANLVRGNGGWPGHESNDDWDQDGWSNFDELYPVSGDPSDPRVHDYPLSISTAALPSAAVGVPYSAHFTVTGGKAPYQFGFGGILLPAGLVVSETGVISGTPSSTTEGTYSCYFQVTDNRGTIVDSNPAPTLTVVGRPQMIGPLEINAEIGNLDIHAPIQVTGGLPPYQLAIIESTNEAGLSLSGNNLISPSGSAVLEDANLPFQVRITDALGQVVIQNCNLHVYAGGGGGGGSSITISASFPADVPWANYSVPVSASGGTGPYTFSISNGSLPGSLWLNPETNTISGQLSYAGTFAFTLCAIDAAGETATVPCSIVVSNSVMPLGLASVRRDVIAGQQFTQTLSGTGGTGGPYSIALDWERVPSDPLDATLKTLSLPEGVTYDGTTGLGGIPMQTGSYSIPVIVANGTGSAPATFILQVNSGGGAPPWAITTPAVLPDLLAGQPQTYFKQIEVADGAAYTLQFAVSGSIGLPAGLNLTSSGLLSGTPGVGVHTFQISVTDNLGRTESRAFTLHCTETPFAFTTPAPGISINGPVDKLMKFQFSTTTPFTAPRTFSMAPGSTLPEGCAISASGYFTYTSPVPKSFEFDLEVADATGRRSSGHFMVHIHAVGETPSGQTPPPGGGPDTEPEEPVEPFSFTYYHAAGSASSGGERRMVQDPFQYSQMPIYGEDPDGPGPVDPPEIGYYWRTGWIEAPETGATGWANDATRSVTFSGETFAENQNSLMSFMDGIMTGPGSSQPGQGASSSWTVGETVGNPILITGGECYFVPDETHVSTSPPASNATVSIGGAETCSLECIGLRGEVKSQAAPGASETFIFSWTEALTTDVGPRVIHYGTATFTNDTSGACWTMAGNGPITNAAPDPHDLLLKPQVIKGKVFSVGPLLPVDIEPDANMAGVVGDVVKSAKAGSNAEHFVTPKKSTELNQDYVLLRAVGVTADQITDGNANQIVQWDGGEAFPGEPLKRRVKRDVTGNGPTEVKIKTKQGGAVAAQMNVWVVWATCTPTNGTAAFDKSNARSQYGIQATASSAWKFVFKIEPAALITDAERPALDGISSKPVPGAGKTYEVIPSYGDGDTAKFKWDVSRQLKETIENPQLIPKADLGWPNQFATGQPAATTTLFGWPTDMAEGNDDPLFPVGVDEDDNPYQVRGGQPYGHAVGELTSADAPKSVYIRNSCGAQGRTILDDTDFREFCRVELWDGTRTIGRFWFRISDFEKWNLGFRATWNTSTSTWDDDVARPSATNSGNLHP